MIDIAKFKYYLRWYPFECDNDQPLWWYNRCTGEVVYWDEADFLSNCQGAEHLEHIVLPVPMIDIVEMEKEFLTMHGYTRIKDKMQQDTHQDFDCQFKCFIDYHGLTHTWHFLKGKNCRLLRLFGATLME